MAEYSDAYNKEGNLISEGNLKLKYDAPRRYTIPAGAEFRFITKGMYFNMSYYIDSDLMLLFIRYFCSYHFPP